MTESEITAFLKIVQCGTVSGAAQELYISQPALSRKIASLEEQLGCTLLLRHKGQRYIELTEAGEKFIPLAKRWQNLLAESAELARLRTVPGLRIGCVGSVCNILLPKVFNAFMQSFAECRLHVYQYHSAECYGHMEDGSLDLALISDDVFSKTVETIPAFKSRFYLLSCKNYTGEAVETNSLKAQQEIRLPWTPEFDLWHDYWFGSAARASIVLDQMPLLEYFLHHTDSWAVAPSYVTQTLAHGNLRAYTLSDPPPEEIIYYLAPKDAHRHNSYADYFLRLLRQELTRHAELTVLL